MLKSVLGCSVADKLFLDFVWPTQCLLYPPTQRNSSTPAVWKTICCVVCWGEKFANSPDMAPYLMADDIQYCAGLTDLLEVTERQYCIWRTCLEVTERHYCIWRTCLAVTEIQYCIWRTCRLVCSLPRAHCDGRRLEQQTRSQYHFLSPLPHKIILL